MSRPAAAPRHVLVTGAPGSGKTTVVRRCVAQLDDLRPAGFFTGEIREGGVRRGFALESLDGRAGTLARTGLASAHRVGRYGVDIPGFEAFLAGIPFGDAAHRLLVIDEIGKMECLSARFVALCHALLEGPRAVLATVALHGGGLIAEAKARPDVRLFTVTAANREGLPGEILGALRTDPEG